MTDTMLTAFTGEYARYRHLAEATCARCSDDQFHLVHGDGSIAMYIHHLGGNLTSRFTDFLTSDGEKPDRQRDREFNLDTSRSECQAVWDHGWHMLAATLATVTDVDLPRTVTIRGQPLTVAAALTRSLAHVAYHVGEIVLLGKCALGDQWVSLSIPRGQSTDYNRNPDKERSPLG